MTDPDLDGNVLQRLTEKGRRMLRDDSQDIDPGDRLLMEIIDRLGAVDEITARETWEDLVEDCGSIDAALAAIKKGRVRLWWE